MKNVELKAATGSKDAEKAKTLGEYKEVKFNVSDPETLEEARSTWGDEKFLALAVAQFHTDSINAKRLELKGKETGTLTLGKTIVAKIKAAKESGDKETLELLATLLGTPIE